MQTALSITLIQTSLYWEDPVANRDQFSEKIKSISGQTDLILLPEMFPTGFTMNASALAEPNEGPTLKWMQALAGAYKAAITGSVIVSEKNKYYNRLYFVFPDGSYKTYDKKHTFTLAGEDTVYTAGTERFIIEYKGWKVCPLVCYDLRFPVWSRNTELYDVLLYVANWPRKRILAWDTLLRARAIENMCYCIGVNRTGTDGNGHEYNGHSAIYDALGAQISTSDFEDAFVQTIVLDKSHIDSTREQFRFLNDRDSFSLT